MKRGHYHAGGQAEQQEAHSFLRAVAQGRLTLENIRETLAVTERVRHVMYECAEESDRAMVDRALAFREAVAEEFERGWANWNKRLRPPRTG